MIGWRDWTLVETKNGWRLRGNYHKIWHSAFAKADETPSEANTHGIYAYNSLSSQRRFLYFENIIGKLELGGKIIVHSDGRIRGEYARIKLFLVSIDDYEDIAQKLAYYNVPILPMNAPEIIENYIQEWEQLNEQLIQQIPVLVTPDDYKVPGEFVPKPITINADFGVSEADIIKMLTLYEKRKAYAKAYYKLRKAQLKGGK